MLNIKSLLTLLTGCFIGGLVMLHHSVHNLSGLAVEGVGAAKPRGFKGSR